MTTSSWADQIVTYDERRNVALPGDKEATLSFCLEHWLGIAQEAIEKRGAFHVALSGGSTPKAIFQKLKECRGQIDWTKVHLYWSDERSVGPLDDDSNYKMAMEAGLSTLGIPEEQIHRMVAEDKLEENAKNYQKLVEKITFDLIMLGMGDDGHTASLFPHTHALETTPGQLVVPNHVPQKQTWRMTFTYELLHRTRNIAFYVIGKTKAEMLDRILSGELDPKELPSQLVGLPSCKALWIADKEAASLL